MSAFELSGVAVLVVTGWAGWIIQELGLRKLSAEEESRLDGFSSFARAHSIVPGLIVIAVVISMFRAASISADSDLGYYYFSLGALVVMVVRVALSQRWLGQRDAPTWYRRSTAIGDAIPFLGLAWWGYVMLAM